MEISSTLKIVLEKFTGIYSNRLLNRSSPLVKYIAITSEEEWETLKDDGSLAVFIKSSYLPPPNFKGLLTRQVFIFFEGLDANKISIIPGEYKELYVILPLFQGNILCTKILYTKAVYMECLLRLANRREVVIIDSPKVGRKAFAIYRNTEELRPFLKFTR